MFNGPYSDKDKSMPVLLTEDQDFISMGDQLSASSDGSHTWLMLGPSDSDNGYLLVPKENTYELQYQGHAG